MLLIDNMANAANDNLPILTRHPRLAGHGTHSRNAYKKQDKKTDNNRHAGDAGEGDTERYRENVPAKLLELGAVAETFRIKFGSESRESAKRERRSELQ